MVKRKVKLKAVKRTVHVSDEETGLSTPTEVTEHVEDVAEGRAPDSQTQALVPVDGAKCPDCGRQLYAPTDSGRANRHDPEDDPHRVDVEGSGDADSVGA